MLTLLTCAALISSAASAAPTYTLIPLGHLSGSDSIAWGMSDAEDIAGWSTSSGVAGGVEAFDWELGTMSGLGSLGVGGDTSFAHDVNNDRIFAGDLRDASGEQGFISQSGALTALGAAGACNVGDIVNLEQSGANGINDYAQVAGWTSTSTRCTEAYLWETGVFTPLGVLSGDPASVASGLNHADQVVGASGGTPYGGTTLWSAVRWDSGVISALPVASPYADSNDTSMAYRINDDGDAVGYAEDGATAQSEPVYWPASGGVSHLGWINATDYFGAAYDINPDDWIVGYTQPAVCNPSLPPSRAFLWTPADGMMDLITLVDSTGAGWTLHTAQAIDASGFIVGYATNPAGDREAYLLKFSDDGEGACCVDGACAELYEDECLDLGGTWYGAGTLCTDYEERCEQVSDEDGACCVEDACVEVTEDECDERGGVWHGVGVPCADVEEECVATGDDGDASME